MTINKYFVFVPEALKFDTSKENKAITAKETQRQALVKQAQQRGL